MSARMGRENVRSRFKGHVVPCGDGLRFEEDRDANQVLHDFEVGCDIHGLGEGAVSAEVDDRDQTFQRVVKLALDRVQAVVHMQKRGGRMV